MLYRCCSVLMFYRAAILKRKSMLCVWRVNMLVYDHLASIKTMHSTAR